jgi:hypothetical protein
MGIARIKKKESGLGPNKQNEGDAERSGREEEKEEMNGKSLLAADIRSEAHVQRFSISFSAPLNDPEFMHTHDRHSQTPPLVRTYT